MTSGLQQPRPCPGPLESRLLAVAGVAAAMLAVGVEARYLLGRRRVACWRNSALQTVPVELGSVQSLSVLPLVEWYAARPGLRTEPGVSYLVSAAGQVHARHPHSRAQHGPTWRKDEFD